jgi:hypothetical protein
MRAGVCTFAKLELATYSLPPDFPTTTKNRQIFSAAAERHAEKIRN